MEDVVDGPGRRKLEPIRHRGNLLGDHKRTVTFGGELGRLIVQFQVFGAEPNLISDLVLFWGWCLGGGIKGFLGAPSASCDLLLSFLGRLVVGDWDGVYGGPGVDSE